VIGGFLFEAALTVIGHCKNRPVFRRLQ
jgi:hypothetical protein